jgi:hypothetical protein
MSCFKQSSSESKVNEQINSDIKKKKNEMSVLLLVREESFLKIKGSWSKVNDKKTHTSSSGKSTIFKQIKIAYLNGFSQDECLELRGSIYGNIVKSMKAMIEASLRLEIAIVNPDNRVYIHFILKKKEKAAMIKEIKDEDLLNSDKVWNEKIGLSIKDLWEDEGIQSTYERRNEYQLEGILICFNSLLKV